MSTFREVNVGDRFFDPLSGDYFIKVGDFKGQMDYDDESVMMVDFDLNDEVEFSDNYSDDYDGQPYEAQEWHDFDPDC